MTCGYDKNSELWDQNVCEIEYISSMLCLEYFPFRVRERDKKVSVSATLIADGQEMKI